MIQRIRVSDITADRRAQSRAAVNRDVVADYAEAMKAGTVFPAIIVFFDGAAYWLADGFHRLDAAVEAGVEEIDAEVREGGLRDAVLFSVGANGAHGLQRTREDKRNAVLVLLNDEEWSKWSDREIARRCCVGADMVGRLRPADTVVQRQYIHPKTGTISTMQVARIGGRADPRPPAGDITSRPAPSSNVLHLGDRLAPVASERAVEKEAEAAEAAARDRSGTTKPRWATGRRGRARETHSIARSELEIFRRPVGKFPIF